MGFKAKTKTMRLVFEGDYDGLEVVAKSVSTGTFMSLVELADKVDNGDMKSVVELFRGFSKALVSWNAEDEDDNPIPADLDGLKSIDFDLALFIIAEWLKGIGNVRAPLESASTSGEISPEVQIPMEIL